MQPIYTVNCNATTSIDCQPDTQSNIYIYMVERGGGTYHLPLLVKPQEEWVSRHTSEKKPEIEQVPNLLMPTRLLRLKPDGKTQPLRPGCWLYIFQDGYLWREICLPNEASNFPFQMDVNLSKQAGKNQRPAECVSTFDFALPYRVNDYCPEYRLAFSEIQWSWSQIQALGGMHPEDPRNLEGEDLQTATTLAALEQRTGLIPLTDADIKASQIHVLNGPSQPMPNAEFQLNDSEELTLPHLLISDPLQDARELKEKQDALIALQNAGLQSMQTGQLGLAQMIQELTAKGDPLALEEHLNPERYDQQLLDTWDSISEQLPERLEAAEEALLAYLQQEAFTLSISDYLQADDLLTNELGLTLFTQLIQHLVMPASLDWLYDLLDDQQKDQHPVYGVARGEKEALNRQLVLRTNQTLPLPDQEDERLKGLSWPDRVQLLALLPATLNGLISKYAELATRQDADKLSQVLEKISKRFEAFTKIATDAKPAALRHWMPPASLKPVKGYRYLNSSFTEAMQKLANLKVLQLRPTGQDIDQFMRRMHTHPGVQGTLTPVLGILLGLNGYFAITTAMKEQSMENSLAATSATVSFFILVMESAQKWVPKPVEVQANSAKQFTKIQASDNALRARIHRLVHGGTFTFVLRVLVIGEALLSTALGIWQAVRGIRTGNTGVLVGGGLMALAGMLSLAAGLAVMKGLLAAMLLTPFTAVLLAIGLVAISVLITVLSEHSSFEQLVRHGWFGSHAYRSRLPNIPQLNAAEAEQTQQALLQTLQNDQQPEVLEWVSREPDLTAELQAYIKQLFHFNAEIKVYNLSQQFMVAHDSPTPPQSPFRVVELYVQLGAFAPIDTLLDGEITLSGMRYPLSSCYVVEERAPGNQDLNAPPQTLRILLEVHENQTYGRISAKAWLDPDGSGQLQIPERPVTCRWNRNVVNMAIHEWQRLKELAVQKPLGLPGDLVMVEQEFICCLVPREQALLRPFWGTGGVH